MDIGASARLDPACCTATRRRIAVSFVGRGADTIVGFPGGELAFPSEQPSEK
jgi:hypothetical protein